MLVRRSSRPRRSLPRSLFGPRTALLSDTDLSPPSCSRLICVAHELSCPVMHLVESSLQGTRDLNPQPSVLETDALPVELVPSGAAPMGRLEPVGDHQWRSLRGTPNPRPNRPRSTPLPAAGAALAWT